MKKRVIYTALFGAYDQIIEPEEVDTNCDYICFTDRVDCQSDVWTFCIVQSDLPPNLANRQYKALPQIYLKEYKQSLYIDANIGLKKSPSSLFDKYLQYGDMAIPRHPFRDCIYEELERCVYSGKIIKEKALFLEKKYEMEGFPRNFGLGENNIILRRHDSDALNNLMMLWYQFIMNDCERDQVSLFYLAWRESFNIKLISESSKRPNPFFYFRPHLHALPVSPAKRIIKFISFRRADNFFFYFMSSIIDQVYGVSRFIVKSIRKILPNFII